MLFDELAPGASFGTAEFHLDDAQLDKWTALFPDDAATRPLMPPGMTAVVIMRAYMKLLTRPPGNVHGSQLTRLARLPRLGDLLHTHLVCSGKELKGGRRWVDFGTDTRDAAGSELFTGRMRILWAA